MTDADLAALARAANAGRWFIGVDFPTPETRVEVESIVDRDDNICNERFVCDCGPQKFPQSAHNAAHIAAWSPERALAALAVIAAARRAADNNGLPSLDAALAAWDAL